MHVKVLLCCVLVAPTICIDIREYIGKESRHLRAYNPHNGRGKLAGRGQVVPYTNVGKLRQKRSHLCGVDFLPPTLTTDEAYSWLDFDPKGIREGTLAFLNFWNRQPLSIRRMRKESTEDAQQEFKQGKYTQANAFQHALWMYRVTMEFDDEIAETYGDAYERSVENPLSERMMNLYNNGVGICLAQYNNTSIINDTAVIYDAFTKGLLMTTVKNNFEDLEFTCEFRLFTKHNPTKYQVITRSKLALSNFNNSRDSKFIVHGWTRNNKSNPWAWMISMKDELLKYSDYNVFLVDWNDGAKYWWYYRSADNTDEAGRQIFEFIRMLKDERGYDECKVHLIGHSLGAQVSGAAGRRIPTIGRITGLDPAKQSFHEKGAFRQLDASDAQFVDIVHTDSMLGCQTPIGDVDFYPNGGNGQPGCGFKMPGCDHGRAIIYFSESINNVCSYKSYPCSLKRKCSSCGNGCNRMGFHATKTPNGTFYLETNSKSVYCKA